MSLKKIQNQLLRESGERGVHSKFDWLKEADGKIVSAEILRNGAKQRNIEFIDYRVKLEGKGLNYSSQIVNQYLLDIQAANKSSFLLLGYAVELALKAGVVSLLIHAPKSLVELTVKRYRHKLRTIAEDLQIQLSEEEMDLLSLLESFIVQETRYPVSSTSVLDYCNKVNTVSNTVSNNDKFELVLRLYNQIRDVVKKIDGTEDDVKIHTRLEIDDDGYLIYREGGGLPPVILIKYSSTQIKTNTNNLVSLRDMLENKNKYDARGFTNLIELRWDSALFFEVIEKKGLNKINQASN